MSRSLRIELAGGLYHVTSRGDRREAIYFSDADRRAWLDVLAQVCERFNWVCHGWCQMTNHYHLIIETVEANLSQGMRQLNGVYTQYVNRSYGMYACNGILFNHESPRRGETFVTRKITRGLANIAQGLEQCIYLGNMDSLRDWGHAKDYVMMQWLMLQQEQPEDFVIATGVQYTVRQFVTWSADELGITLEYVGKGVEEHAVVKAISGDKTPALKVGDVIVRVDPRYFRPAEVETLLGDPTKAKEKLGWVPEITVQEMCAEMVAHDLDEARRHALLKASGYSVAVSTER